MSLDYKILSSTNAIIVIIQSNKRLPDIFCSIESKIKDINYCGKVVLDLLVSNGLSNRFFEIPFESGSLKSQQIKKIKFLDEEILDLTNAFFRSNRNLIVNSHISRIEKSKIINSLQVY